MSATSLERDGRDAYKRGDYTKALDYFNRAVGRGNPSPKLLDQLAATHSKLSDYPAALAAAKKAIQAGRDDATGYLRGGLVLKKMDKPSVALEIYAYGLKSIKHVGQGYEQLQKVHDELLQQLAPKNSVDPLTMLPREMAIYVLEYLSFRQRIVISRVSKGWMKFIRSEPSLWAHLDLSAARGKVRSSFVSRAINTARDKLTTATLNQLYDFDKVLNALTHRPLESLTLMNTGLQGQNLVNAMKSSSKLRHLNILEGTDISTDTLQEIIRKRATSTLETLECHTTRSLLLERLFDLDMPNLSSLSIHSKASLLMLREGVANLVLHAPNLKRLTLREEENSGMAVIDISQLPLEYFDFRFGIAHLDYLRLPSTLRVLKLSHQGRYARSDFLAHSVPSAFDNLAGTTLADLPHLEQLELDVRLQWEDFEGQLSEPGGSKLQSLSLKLVNLPSPARESIMVFPSRLSELRHLSLRESPGFDDDCVQAMLEGLKQVTRVDVSGSSITGVGVKAILKAGHVKELVVNDCHKLGRDAVDWARAQGMKVEFRMSSTEGGRKVRY